MPIGVTVRLLLAGCREEYHDLQGLIRPGGLAIRSCDPHICIYPDQPSRLVGMRGDFQRKGSASSNLSNIVQKQPSTASWSRPRPPPRKAVNFKNWNDASLRRRITSRSSRTITRVQCTFRTMANPAARPWPSRKNTFCGVLGRRSSCNGTPYRRRCNGRSSTPPGPWASCWRQRRCGDRSPGFCTSTRMIAVATN